MTLIISFADRNCVIQISDRRLMESDGKREWPVDHHNKAVVVCDRCTISFTGLARMGAGHAMPVDLWIVEALRRHNAHSLSDACKALRSEATAAFQSIPLLSTYKRNAFAVSGWSVRTPEDRGTPVIACVSNAFHLSSGLWDAQASGQFWINLASLRPKTRFMLHTFGQPIRQHRRIRLLRTLRRGLARGLSYGTATNLMASAIINTAKRDPSPNVGEELNVVAMGLPSRPGARLHLMTNEAPTGLGIQWCSWPGGPEQFGPNMVCGGTSATHVVATRR